MDDNPADALDGEEVHDELKEPSPQDKVNKKKTNPSTGEILSDVGKQFSKEALIGLGGTWGDLAEIAGIRKQPFKSVRTGEKPKIEHGITLPSSEDWRSLNDWAGGPGEAETEQGEYAGNIGKLFGGGLSFGVANPLPAILGGTAGQGVKQAGGGPLLQAAAEIAASLITGKPSSSSKSGSQKLNSVNPEVQQKINKLRELGYTDEQITLAINHASRGKKFGVKATKGEKTEEAFQEFAEHSDEMIEKILESGVPGIGEGPKKVHELASEAYGQLAEQAKNVPVTKFDKFFDTMHSTVEEIRETLGHNTDAKQFIIEMSENFLDIVNNPTAAKMMNFYRQLNASGKWVSRQQKDRLLTKVKNSIKEAFIDEGPQGKKLAQEFEKVNSGVQKAYAAEKVYNILNKSRTADGWNYKKLDKIFDNPENVKLLNETLGTARTKNIQTIARVGKEVKDFDKSWKAVSALTGTIPSGSAQIAYYLYSGNWVALAATKGFEVAARKLAEKSLTDPRFQQLLIRGLHAIKQQAPSTLRSSMKSMQEYLGGEDIDVNLYQPRG